MDDLKLLDGFGERLRSERTRLSMTQEELATRVGVQQQTIYKYEKGQVTPPLGIIYRLITLGFNLQFILLDQHRYVPNPDDFPPEVLTKIEQAITKFERAFSGGAFSDAAKYRMMLILLDQHFRRPSSAPLTDIQAFELFMGKK